LKAVTGRLKIKVTVIDCDVGEGLDNAVNFGRYFESSDRYKQDKQRELK